MEKTIIIKKLALIRFRNREKKRNAFKELIKCEFFCYKKKD